jgi:hypothetical protein
VALVPKEESVQFSTSFRTGPKDRVQETTAPKAKEKRKNKILHCQNKEQTHTDSWHRKLPGKLGSHDSGNFFLKE